MRATLNNARQVLVNAGHCACFDKGRIVNVEGSGLKLKPRDRPAASEGDLAGRFGQGLHLRGGNDAFGRAGHEFARVKHLPFRMGKALRHRCRPHSAPMKMKISANEFVSGCK